MRLSIISGMMILPFTANALSATTAKTIKGTEPTFKALSGENRLGFTVNGKFYSESSVDSDENNTGNIVAGTSKSFNASLTFNDFAVKTLTSADFTVLNDYDDSDGDVAKASGAFTIGATSYKWLQADGTVVQPADYGKMIGCGSGYAMPLKLEITLENVQVHSEYGDPRDSVLTPLTKTYQIDSTTGICFAMPNQMEKYPQYTWYGINSITGTQTSWNDTANTTRHSDNGGGYNSDFDPKWGFKASASTKFPTTGFPGAQFQLVMTGAPDDWTYSVSATPSGSVKVVNTATASAKVGDVIFVSKPMGSVKVTAMLKSNNSIKHDYEFTPTNVWLVLKPKTTSYTYAQAKTACSGGESGLPTRAEFTNSPRITAPMGWSYVFNASTRAIGGGVFNEWGYMDDMSKSYPNSQWMNINYWTQEVHTTGGDRFIVNASYGRVNPYYTTAELPVACRG